MSSPVESQLPPLWNSCLTPEQDLQGHSKLSRNSGKFCQFQDLCRIENTKKSCYFNEYSQLLQDLCVHVYKACFCQKKSEENNKNLTYYILTGKLYQGCMRLLYMYSN